MIRLITATSECVICGRRFHQIDGTEERALSVVRAAMEEHVATDRYRLAPLFGAWDMHHEETHR